MTFGSTSIKHQSDAKVSDRCLIDVDPMVFAIWVGDFIPLLTAPQVPETIYKYKICGNSAMILAYQALSHGGANKSTHGDANQFIAL